MFPTVPLERVREGMDVYDETGTRLGKVVRVQVAAAGGTTAPPDSDLLDEVARIVPSPPDTSDISNLEASGASPFGHDPMNLPNSLEEPIRAHLRESGFIEVDGIDLTDAQKYIAGDHINAVTGDRVEVRAGREIGSAN
jgi:hypothetical protein